MRLNIRRFSFITSIICIIGLLTTEELSAQLNKAQLLPSNTYRNGMELFENKKYGAAYQQFKVFLAESDDHIMSGNALYYKGRCAVELFQDDSEQILTGFIADYPEHQKVQSARYHLSRYHFRDNRYARAAGHLSELDPYYLSDDEMVEYHFMSGYTNMRRDDLDTAIYHFGEIKDFDNHRRDYANYYHAYASYTLGYYEDALQGFTRISSKSPFDTIVPVYIMQGLIKTERYSAAVAYGNSIIESEKNITGRDKLKLLLADAHFMQENYNIALRYYREAMQANVSFSDAQHYNMGLTAHKVGQYSVTISALEKLNLSEDEKGQNVAYHLADAYVKTNNKVKARNLFGFASGIRDANDRIQKESAFNYAKLSYELNYQREAINSFRNFARDYAGSDLAVEAQATLSKIFLATRNFREAIEIIEEIPERSTEMNETYQKLTYYYGISFYENRTYDQAIRNFNKSLTHRHSQEYEAKAHFWAAEANFYKGDYAKAVSHYQSFLNNRNAPRTPHYASGFYGLGYAYFKQEDYSRSLRQFQLYMSHDRENRSSDRYADANLRVADSYFGSKDYVNALRHYNTAIDEFTKDVDYALFQKGIIQGLQGRHQDKINTLEQLTQNFRNSRFSDDALFAIADVQLLQANYQTAMRGFQYLIQEYPNSPYIRLAYMKTGLIHYSLGEDELAISVFQEVIKSSPHSVEAKESLTALQNIYIERGEEDKLFAFLEDIPDFSLTFSYKDSTSYESAMSAFRGRQFERSAESFESYLEQFPEGYFRLQAYYYLGESYLQLNETSKALASLESVVLLSPNEFSEKAIRHVARIQFDKGNYESAFQSYQRYLSYTSDRKRELEARTGAMRSAYYAKKYDASVSFGLQLSRMSDLSDYDRRLTNFYLGKSFYEEEQFEEAYHYLMDIKEESRAEMAAEVIYLLASIEFKNRNFHQSQELIFQLRESYLHYEYFVAKAFILLGDIFIEKEDFFQAKHTFQSIIDNYEGEDEIKTVASDRLEKVKMLEQAN